jgi:hypothetical protein
VLPVTAELDESSGLTGRPYSWIRSMAEPEQVRRKLAIMVRHLIESGPWPSRPVVTINAFSMGAWATGTNVSRALGRVGLIKSPGRSRTRCCRSWTCSARATPRRRGRLLRPGRPAATAQASTGPAARVTGTGMTSPCTGALHCSQMVDSSAAAVTTT